MADKKSRIITPHAALVVWNFNDSMSSWNVGSIKGAKDSGSQTSEADVLEVHETIISTISLRRISTSKQKAQPVGSFTAELAPTSNWVAALTPGSWCAILMSTRPITSQDTKKANKDTLKMFGKIISVRAQTNVDQTTGAIMTTYIVMGEDWGHIFNNNLYIDELTVSNGDQNPWHRATFKINDTIAKLAKKGLPSTSDIVKGLIDLWGNAQDKAPPAKTITLASGPNFILPEKVAQFLSLGTTINNKISDVINSDAHRKFGRLIGDNKYEDISESVGVVPPQELAGVRSLWQLMVNVSNPILNECLTDLDFDEDGAARLRMWKRIKPFLISASNEKAILNDSYLKDTFSLFTNLKKTTIPTIDIISTNVGTNWRDKYNFVEIRLNAPVPTDMSQTNTFVKNDSQIYDQSAFAREGFRPMIVVANKMLPIRDDGANMPLDVMKWKYLLKEWYFNTHRMLNGSISVIGQINHIPIGSNILVEAKVFGPGNNWNKANRDGKATHVLAHVESVSHEFTVDEAGARNYISSISFVRGIMVDKSGKIVADDTNAALRDKKAKDSSSSSDRNSKNIFGTSTEMDFNPIKLKRK